MCAKSKPILENLGDSDISVARLEELHGAVRAHFLRAGLFSLAWLLALALVAELDPSQEAYWLLGGMLVGVMLHVGVDLILQEWQQRKV